jgi:hypothetical protein
MVNVGMPYLESGESLILTTDRVRVNSVQYDILLTSRYLLLVDDRYAHFEPRMIPLLTIQSVKAGKTANGDPVITLFFEDTSGSNHSESMVLLFSQQSGEQRKRERDIWFKTLMGLIVSVRQETSSESTATAVPDIGIRPSKRRTIMPEIPHPYTKVVESRPAQIELNIIHEEPESLVFSEEKQEFPEISSPGAETEHEFPLKPDTMKEISEGSPEPAAPLEPTSSQDSATPVEFAGQYKEISICRSSLIPEPVSGTVPDTSRELAESGEPVSSQDGAITAEFAGEYKEISICRSSLIPEPVSGMVPDTSRELTDSREFGESFAGAITTEFMREYEETPVVQEMLLRVPAPSGWGIPVTPETDNDIHEQVPVSLLAAVKSLSTLRDTAGVPETQLPSLPNDTATPVPLAGETGSPDTRMIHEEMKNGPPYSAMEEKAGPVQHPLPSAISENTTASPETVSPAIPEPMNGESTTGPGYEALTEPPQPETGKGNEVVQQPPPEDSARTPGSPPPSAGPEPRWKSFIAVAVIVIIILGIAGVMVFYPQTPAVPAVETKPLPAPTLQQTPQPTPVIVPQTGVWVRVAYPRTFAGWVGNTGAIRAVNGSGDQIYTIPESDGIVQVQVHKTDNSGDTLTVEVYRDGNVINQRNVSIPMGSIDLLVDAKTGNPPGLPPVVTPTANQTGSGSPRIMYF